MPEHDRREPIVVAAPPRGVIARTAGASYDSSRARARRSAASRSRSSRTVRMVQQRAAQTRRAVESSCRRASTPEASMGGELRVDGRASLPTASKFSSAKPSGSISAWQLAQTGLARCCSIRSRIDSTRAVRRRSLRAPARSAAAAAAARRAGSRESTCRAAPARCDSDTTSPSGCCPGRAARGARSSGSVTRRKRLP